ncbi:MAG: hypothetical protein DRQ55_18055 [Planctomycetota bacterium]|nr:MAG: hypothetical protein DRQ55_18055 [Planctomycetota bacterium]
MLRRVLPCVLTVFCALLSVSVAIGQALPADELPAGLAADDWSSIRGAYDAGRHAVRATQGGHVARNPGQRWQTRFDGRGFSTQPDASGWTWGLELLRFGFEGSQQALSQPARVTAAGSRLAYDWDERLTEWYLNDTRGLEHGYTVHARPGADTDGQAQGPLSFTLAVRGGLTPRVSDDGRSVRFEDAHGGVVLNYAGLTVFDADLRPLPARFERVAEGLLLSVDERGARYPLTIDPVAQQAYLKASNTESGDHFGWSVAVSGDTVVVGAKTEDSNATGVNGDQNNNGAAKSGAAYVFVFDGSTWSQQAYLKADVLVGNFGWSVDVSGDTLVVGALVGGAYVFVRNGTVWSQQARLNGPVLDFDEFGFSVGVSGDTVVVGAPWESSNAAGVNGDNTDNSYAKAGAAFVFVRNGTSWSQQAYLKSSNPWIGHHFGEAVAVSGDTVVVGAKFESGGSTGVNGDQTQFVIGSSGAAYVFVRDGTTWSQQAYLKASNTGGNDWFGHSVAIADETLVVGANWEDSDADGVDGDQADNSADSAGAAYVFVRSGTDWSQQAYLKASNSDQFDNFGISVAVSGDTVLVGSRLEDSNATGVDGDESDNSFVNSGAAYLYSRTGTTWSHQAYLKASNTGAPILPATDGDFFGWSVGLSGGLAIVGADQESSAATGVGGDQSSNGEVHSGAAYIFEIPSDTWTDHGCALAGGSGDPLLVGSGPLSAGSNNSLELSNAAPGALTGLFVAVSSTPVAFRGGVLKPYPAVVSGEPYVTDGLGGFLIPVVMPPGFPVGTELWVQWAILDAAAVQGVALSNAVLGVTP